MTENRSQTWTEKPIIQGSHCPWQCEEPSCSSNPQSDITSEEHLTILLRFLSTIPNCLVISTLWIRTRWVRGDNHIPNTHTRGSTQLSEITFNTTTSGVQPTTPEHFHTPPLSNGLDTTCTGISVLVRYRTKSCPKSGLGPTRMLCKRLFLEEYEIESGMTRRIGPGNWWLYLV